VAQVYGITAELVRAKFWPDAAAFSTTTKPTAANVALIIADASTEVNAIVRAQGITPADLVSGTEAYEFLRTTVELAAHWFVAKSGLLQAASPGADADWEEYQRRIEKLEEKPERYLSDVLPTNSEGVGSHIKRLSLSDDDEGEDENIAPIVRRNDEP